VLLEGVRTGETLLVRTLSEVLDLSLTGSSLRGPDAGGYFGDDMVMETQGGTA